MNYYNLKESLIEEKKIEFFASKGFRLYGLMKILNKMRFVPIKESFDNYKLIDSSGLKIKVPVRFTTDDLKYNFDELVKDYAEYRTLRNKILK